MESDRSSEKTAARETVSSRLGFIMLAAGSAIGLGNVWRFPYMAGTNGGGLFVIIYLLFLLLLGFPVMAMELAIGRASRRNLYGAMRDLPEKRPSLWRIPAGIVFSGNLILMLMYTTVTGWMLSYFADFLTGRLEGLTSEAELTGHFASLLEDPVKMGVCMILATLIGSVICGLGLRQGTERITKVLMLGLFVLLAGLSVYALFLPGAAEGMKFYLAPSIPKDVSIFKISSAAMSQAFFTLSLGIGSLEIFGSYTKKENTLATESLLIIFCDTLVALLAGLLVFSACFSYGIQVNGGPGLALISLTGIFNHLPGGRIAGMIFFLFLSIACLTTIIAVFENLIAFMMDEWNFSRKKGRLHQFPRHGPGIHPLRPRIQPLEKHPSTGRDQRHPGLRRLAHQRHLSAAGLPPDRPFLLLGLGMEMEEFSDGSQYGKGTSPPGPNTVVCRRGAPSPDPLSVHSGDPRTVLLIPEKTT